MTQTGKNTMAVRELLRQRGIRLHDSVIAELATRAEVERLREALRDIAEPPSGAERLWLSIIARDALRSMGVSLRSEEGS